MDPTKTYYLLGPDRKKYPSKTKGKLGGHFRDRTYGRLDCPVALRFIAQGKYVANRVFFADEEAAIASGFRPCNGCMPERYREWEKGGQPGTRGYPWLVLPKKSNNDGETTEWNMHHLTWPVPDMNERGRKIEYRAWFADGYDTARTPYRSLKSAIYGEEGAVELFEQNVKYFESRGPCRLFAVAYKDDPEVLIVPGDGFVYLVDRGAIGNIGMKERDRRRVRQACGTRRMPLDEYRRYSGASSEALDSKMADVGDPWPQEGPRETQVACDINPPERIQATVYRILRDTALARRIKQIHDWECQICGHFIVLPDGSRYAEVHHIQPLGQPHGGTDEESNVMVVCPNHHAELDYGVLRIDVSALRKREGHVIDPKFVKYHNDFWRTRNLEH